MALITFFEPIQPITDEQAVDLLIACGIESVEEAKAFTEGEALDMLIDTALVESVELDRETIKSMCRCALRSYSDQKLREEIVKRPQVTTVIFGSIHLSKDQAQSICRRITWRLTEDQLQDAIFDRLKARRSDAPLSRRSTVSEKMSGSGTLSR